LILQTIFR